MMQCKYEMESKFLKNVIDPILWGYEQKYHHTAVWNIPNWNALHVVWLNNMPNY